MHTKIIVKRSLVNELYKDKGDELELSIINTIVYIQLTDLTADTFAIANIKA